MALFLSCVNRFFNYAGKVIQSDFKHSHYSCLCNAKAINLRSVHNESKEIKDHKQLNHNQKHVPETSLIPFPFNSDLKQESCMDLYK